MIAAISTLTEFVYVLIITIVAICIMFGVFLHNHSKQHRLPKIKKAKKHRWPHCSKLFNDPFRFFGHNTTYYND